jgi:hypothetical protein
LAQAADAGDDRFDPKSASEYIPTEDASPNSASRRKYKKEFDSIMQNIQPIISRRRLAMIHAVLKSLDPTSSK